MNAHPDKQKAIKIAEAMARLDKYNQPVAKARRTLAGANRGALRYAMQQGMPGAWASDHRDETNHFTGWDYVAIHTLATQASQCDVNAYHIRTANQKREDIAKALHRLPKDEREKWFAKSYNLENDETVPVPFDHPLLKLLRRPNPRQSGASFRYEQVLQLRLTGSSCVWNVPNQLGKVVERYVIPTAICEPKEPTSDHPYGVWRIQPEASRWGVETGWFLYGALLQSFGYEIDARDMQMIRYPHPLYKDDGQSPLAATALWTDSANQIDKSRWYHMKQGPDQSVIVTLENFEGDQADLERLEARWNEKFAGVERHGRAFFVGNTGADGGTKVEPVTTTPREMNYGESFEQLRDSKLAAHGVPPLAAGIETATGREGLYAPLEQFTFLTIQPILDLLAEEDTEFFAWQFSEQDIYIEYQAKSIKDPERDRADREQLIQAKAITKGELRTEIGYEKFGDERDEEIAGVDKDAMAMQQQQMQMQQQFKQNQGGNDQWKSLGSAIKSMIEGMRQPTITVTSNGDDTVWKHAGPGTHPGTGTEQKVHAGGRGGGSKQSGKKKPMTDEEFGEQVVEWLKPEKRDQLVEKLNEQGIKDPEGKPVTKESARDALIKWSQDRKREGYEDPDAAIREEGFFPPLESEQKPSKPSKEQVAKDQAQQDLYELHAWRGGSPDYWQDKIDRVEAGTLPEEDKNERLRDFKEQKRMSEKFHEGAEPKQTAQEPQAPSKPQQSPKPTPAPKQQTQGQQASGQDNSTSVYGSSDKTLANHPLIQQLRNEPTLKTENPHRIDPLADADGDGVTDASRVGVPGSPKTSAIPRLPNLTQDERAVESAAAMAFESNPSKLIDTYYSHVTGQADSPDNPLASKTFNADDAKEHFLIYSASTENKARYNVALHQTAHAMAKGAFIRKLDEVANLPQRQRRVLITQGGTAAGKGYSLKTNERLKSLGNNVGAVWDATGEQNGTDMAWLQKELDKRGIKGHYVYIDTDPIRHKMAGIQGAIARATKKGRISDAQLLPESYVISRKNFDAMRRQHKNADFLVIDSNRPDPAIVKDFVTPDYNAGEIQEAYIRAVLDSDLPVVFKRGALLGQRIFANDERAQPATTD